jgi:dienelactone hydrolase
MNPLFRFFFLSLLIAMAQPVQAASSHFWCNDRFLDPATKPFDAQHLKIAQRGYLYAMAAALALQKTDAESRAYYFSTPARLRQIDRPRRDRSGFELASFELLDAPAGALKEVVVAFSGSNDNADWNNTNLGDDTRQYTLARRYLRKLASRPEYRGIPIIATGFSLGGALAVHVTKHRETRHLVSQTWAFNPSPKTWVGNQMDSRIWLAATASDGLGPLRDFGASLLPGVGEIGAPPAQRAEGFYLLEANPVISHYRWVLTRNILHVADLAWRIEHGDDASSEALQILQSSRFRSCKSESDLAE